MANTTSAQTSGNTTVKQKNRYSQPSKNTVKVDSRKSANTHITQTTNEKSAQHISATVKRGANVTINQRGTGNKKIVMSVPRGAHIVVRGKSRVKVG